MEIDILLNFICMKISLTAAGKSFWELLILVRYVVISYMIVDSKSEMMTDLKVFTSNLKCFENSYT